jgi:hypothetical protein
MTMITMLNSAKFSIYISGLSSHRLSSLYVFFYFCFYVAYVLPIFCFDFSRIQFHL